MAPKAKRKKEKPVKISIISDTADLLAPAPEEIDAAGREMSDLFGYISGEDMAAFYEALGKLAESADQPERIEFTTDGVLTDDGERIEIAYDESELCGLEGSRTTLLFDRASPELVTMVRTGASTGSLVFGSPGSRQRCTYDTGIMPPFEICVLTRKIDNKITGSGGTLNLDYVIELRGVKTEFNNLTMQVKEIGAPEGEPR